MSVQLTIQLCELQHGPYAADDLRRTSGLELERLAEELQPLVTLQRSLAGDTVIGRAGLNVGTTRIGQLRVDIRPRMAAAELITLVRYALGGQIDAWQRSAIELGFYGLDELICVIFADELMQLRQKGLSRNYVNRREPLQVLRGRPDFIASFPWNDRGMTSLTCRYHELTTDNLDNQLLRAALERATLMETSVETRRRLLEHRHAWSELASLRPVGRDDFVSARSRYTRLSEHYRLAHNLAEVLLLGDRPAAAFDAGRHPTGGLRLNMAELFESFVERLLNESLCPRGFTVRSQAADGGALLDGIGVPYRRVKPDVVVFRDNVPVAVIDAKYKNYWRSDGQIPMDRIGNEDLYQLFFYASRLRTRYALPHLPPAFIVAPLPAEDERGRAGVIPDRFQQVTWRAGNELGGRIQLVLLPVTDLLRAMRRRREQGVVTANDLPPELRLG